MLKKITSKFAIKTISNIDEVTNYESINDMMKQLYDNAATLPKIIGRVALWKYCLHRESNLLHHHLQ